MKRILTLAIFLLMPLWAASAKTDWQYVNVLDKTVTLDSLDGTNDSVTVISDFIPLACDSFSFVYELVSADSLLLGTSRDSIGAYMKLRYYTSNKSSNAHTWATYDSLYDKAYATAGNVVFTPAIASNQSKLLAKLYVLLVSHQPSAKQTVRIRVYMVKKWN